MLAIRLDKEIEKDYFESGVSIEPGSGASFDLNNFRGHTFESLSELASMMGLSEAPDAWLTTEDGRIDYQRMENDDGYEASNSELNMWRAGDIEYLWLANYIFGVVAIVETTPTQEEISSDLGIEEY